MNRFLVILASAAAVAAAPAAAITTFDAFASFDGTNSGNFVYGYTNSVTLTPFDTSSTNGGCALGTGSTCLYDAGLGAIPQASVGGSFATVDVPADAVLVHPGNSDAQSVYAAFVSPTQTAYTYSIDLRAVGIDNSSGGVGYTPYTAIGGVVTLGTRGVLPAYNATVSFNGSTVLAAGQQFGVIIDRNGVFFGDSTSVGITLSTIPEPATWGLMLVGFAMVGVAARRRSKTVAA